MAKAILLVRVSTDRQSFDEQEQQLFQLAIKDGYSEDNIIPICEKESGRKLKEDERKGLNKMKELIESDSSINCVYAWEISRIARRKKILFSILEYLTDRKIQLIIKEPYLKLLNDDGSINDGAETTFTLFAQLSESEMRNKDARFKRAKDEMKRNHQYRGGFLPFGYKKNDEGKIIIDEEKAPLVRLIFDLYCNHKFTPYTMPKELASRGIDMSYSHIDKILGNENYSNGELYPILISKEIWEKKIETAKRNATVIDKSPNYFYGAKLIKCDCGSSYVGAIITATYMCKAKYIGKNCNNTKGISINIMDSLLWWCAKQEYAMFLANKSQETKQRLIDEKEVWLQKLNALDSLYNKIQEKLDRQAELYGDLAISKEVYNQRKAKILEEKKELDNNAVNYQNEIERIEGILNAEYNSEDSNLIDGFIAPMMMKNEELLIELDKLSDKRKYEVVHQFIKEARVKPINQYKKIVTVNLINHIGLEREYEFVVYPNRQNKSECVEFINGDKLEGFNFILRFRRKPPKDIEEYRRKHAEYARNSRRKRKEKGAN